MFGSRPRIENQGTTAASSFCRPNVAPGPRDCAGVPLLLQLDPPPGLIWIEAGQLARQRGGVDPEIFSVDEALVVDDEGLNSRHAILRGPRQQREPANHLALH